MIIDTHCHIDMYKNPIQVLEDCESKGVVVISMTNLPSHFELGRSYFRDKKNVRQALGFHPIFVGKENSKELKKFKTLINQTSYIGEIGLDFSKEGIETKEIQVQTFQKLLSIINESKGDKILSLHSRGAEKEVLNCLIRNNIKSAIFHWYSGKLEVISEIVKAGYYFSVNSAMIKSKNGKDIISKIPLEKILVESDGPFIDLNNKPIRPYELIVVYEFLAKKFEISLKEIEDTVKRNFYTLLKPLEGSIRIS